MDFGEQIKQQRKALGISQEEVAKRLFVTRQTISNWENNKNYPDLSTLVKISDVYQVSIDSLLKEDEKLKKYLTKKQVRTVYNPMSDLSTIMVGILLIVLAISRSNTSLPEVVYSVITSVVVLVYAAWAFFDVRLYNLINDSKSKKAFQERASYKVFINVLLVILWILLVITVLPGLLYLIKNVAPNATMKLCLLKLNTQLLGDSSTSLISIAIGTIGILYGIVNLIMDIVMNFKNKKTAPTQKG